MFFSLVFFQKQGMQPNAPQMMPQQEDFMFDYPHHQPSMPPIQQNNQQEPPIAIPLLFILGVSSIFILCFLKYIDKSFVTPLTLIQENLKEIKEGRLETKFENNSENKAINETFNTLNDMVDGLKEKEKLQNNFIQTIAHDLRAPIVAQERAISILQDEFNNHELLEGMMANNETYLKMINLILEAYNEKKINIDKTEINLYKITNSIIKELKPMADKKNITIKNRINDNFIVYADFISINRIMMNLISNSIENIENNKTISIKGIIGSNKTRILIEDNGAGIDEETIKHIFEKYSSSNKSRKKIVSGLGLYIVKDLITQNGGTIQIESELDKYTKFIIELPTRDKNEKI
ncbi:MAG: ATP-binding protein [Candidatus Gastranaerophilales bacterium]|nr:ATP-binding protein [Candidatus Gastranaerophilales bacterium]